MIVKYLRREGKPYGCMIAVGVDDIGISICDPKDTFTKKEAIKVAQVNTWTYEDNEKWLLEKIKAYKGKTPLVTAETLQELVEFKYRCKKYFKVVHNYDNGR